MTTDDLAKYLKNKHSKYIILQSYDILIRFCYFLSTVLVRRRVIAGKLAAFWVAKGMKYIPCESVHNNLQHVLGSFQSTFSYFSFVYRVMSHKLAWLVQTGKWRL